MTDPIKEAVERLIDDIADSQPSAMVVVESNDLRTLLAAHAADRSLLDEKDMLIAEDEAAMRNLDLEIADLRSKLDKAVKALEPFAKCAERLIGADEKTLFGWTGKHMVTLGDFRSASSTLKDIDQ